MSDVPPIVLTVAGSDPSGGAGLQSDLKTIHLHGGYGAAIPTLITVQNTLEVVEVELLSADLVRAQLRGLLGDVRPAAAKTGALGSPAVAHVIGSFMAEAQFPWVVDPVWLPTRGRPLAKGPIVDAYKEAILPHATLVTPNAQEAALLADRSDISEEIVRANSHVQQFRGLMEDDTPAGRPLNFLLQEFNREFNTMGSKSGKATMSHIIVAVKSELEKLREQIQNVE